MDYALWAGLCSILLIVTLIKTNLNVAFTETKETMASLVFSLIDDAHPLTADSVEKIDVKSVIGGVISEFKLLSSLTCMDQCEVHFCIVVRFFLESAGYA